MAKIPLSLFRWDYDDESKRIIATFVDVPAEDHPDPVNFTPTLSLCVELLPRVVDEEPVEQPEQAEINELNNVVDQLIIDILMGGV